MEPLVKIVNDFKHETIFVKGSISDVSQVLSSPLTTFFMFFYVFYEQQKNYITVFGTVTATCQLRILPIRIYDRNIKNTRARCEMCLNTIIRTPE